MSRYRVRYLPGGIQHDVGLAVKMRRAEAPVMKSDSAACDVAIGGLFWLGPSGDFDVESAGAGLGDIDDRLALRVLGDLCACAVTIAAEVDDGSTVYTWTEAGGWDSSPPWGGGSPITFADGVMFGADLANWMTYNSAVLTVTVTVCDDALIPAVIDTGGA